MRNFNILLKWDLQNNYGYVEEYSQELIWNIKKILKFYMNIKRKILMKLKDLLISLFVMLIYYKNYWTL